MYLKTLLKIKNLKILDVGGGYYSWLTNYFTKYGEVTNIDIINTHKENGKLNSNKVYYNSKINFINGNFLKVGKNYQIIIMILFTMDVQ